MHKVFHSLNQRSKGDMSCNFDFFFKSKIEENIRKKTKKQFSHNRDYSHRPRRSDR